MTKKEKFEVAVARFEAFLSAGNLAEQYFLEFREEWLDGDSDENYTRWLRWAKERKPHLWVSAAFDWQNTSKGVDVWSNFDHMWLTWLCVILYK